MSAVAIDIRLPRPHALQAEILRHPAKRKIICAGRRGGKTLLAALVAVVMMLKGRRVLLASPTQQQADVFWRYVKRWCHAAIVFGALTKNETNRTLEMAAGGGSLKVKTASDPDVLRGDFADFVVLDECALLRPEAWYEVVAPMLLDNDGACWFISTPRRRNWFFGLYQRALEDMEGGRERWHAWHFPSTANPHLSADALAEIVEDMTEEAYEQEILAKFLEGEGSVFRKIAEALIPTIERDKGLAIGSRPDEHRGHLVVGGLDWARHHDFTAMSVYCVTCGREVALDRFNKIDWEFQRGRVKALLDAWQIGSLLAELNSIGEPNIEALQAEGLPVVGFETTSTTKPQIVRALALSLERGQSKWLDTPVATGELEAYEGIESKATGYMRYGAPDGMHDDTVMCRMLAWRAALQGGPAIDTDAAHIFARAR